MSNLDLLVVLTHVFVTITIFHLYEIQHFTTGIIHDILIYLTMYYRLG